MSIRDKFLLKVMSLIAIIVIAGIFMTQPSHSPRSSEVATTTTYEYRYIPAPRPVTLPVSPCPTGFYESAGWCYRY